MRISWFVLPLLVFATACITQPDDKSGPDAERHQAKALAVGKPEADTVDYSGGDRTDWRVIDLQDGGFLTVEVMLDNPDANVTVALFDRYGKPMNRFTHRKGDQPQIKVTSEVGLGKYFVQVYAEKEGDKTGYSIRALVK
jgi:hypothetical protein